MPAGGGERTSHALATAERDGGSGGTRVAGGAVFGGLSVPARIFVVVATAVISLLLFGAWSRQAEDAARRSTPAGSDAGSLRFAVGPEATLWRLGGPLKALQTGSGSGRGPGPTPPPTADLAQLEAEQRQRLVAYRWRTADGAVASWALTAPPGHDAVPLAFCNIDTGEVEASMARPLWGAVPTPAAAPAPAQSGVAGRRGAAEGDRGHAVDPAAARRNRLLAPANDPAPSGGGARDWRRANSASLTAAEVRRAESQSQSRFRAATRRNFIALSSHPAWQATDPTVRRQLLQHRLHESRAAVLRQALHDAAVGAAPRTGGGPRHPCGDAAATTATSTWRPFASLVLNASAAAAAAAAAAKPRSSSVYAWAPPVPAQLCASQSLDGLAANVSAGDGGAAMLDQLLARYVALARSKQETRQGDGGGTDASPLTHHVWPLREVMPQPAVAIAGYAAADVASFASRWRHDAAWGAIADAFVTGNVTTFAAALGGSAGGPGDALTDQMLHAATAALRRDVAAGAALAGVNLPSDGGTSPGSNITVDAAYDDGSAAARAADAAASAVLWHDDDLAGDTGLAAQAAHWRSLDDHLDWDAQTHTWLNLPAQSSLLVRTPGIADPIATAAADEAAPQPLAAPMQVQPWLSPLITIFISSRAVQALAAAEVGLVYRAASRLCVDSLASQYRARRVESAALLQGALTDNGHELTSGHDDVMREWHRRNSGGREMRAATGADGGSQQRGGDGEGEVGDLLAALAALSSTSMPMAEAGPAMEPRAVAAAAAGSPRRRRYTPEGADVAPPSWEAARAAVPPSIADWRLPSPRAAGESSSRGFVPQAVLDAIVIDVAASDALALRHASPWLSSYAAAAIEGDGSVPAAFLRALDDVAGGVAAQVGRPGPSALVSQVVNVSALDWATLSHLYDGQPLPRVDGNERYALVVEQHAGGTASGWAAPLAATITAGAVWGALHGLTTLGQALAPWGVKSTQHAPRDLVAAVGSACLDAFDGRAAVAAVESCTTRLHALRPQEAVVDESWRRESPSSRDTVMDALYDALFPTLRQELRSAVAGDLHSGGGESELGGRSVQHWRAHSALTTHAQVVQLFTELVMPPGGPARDAVFGSAAAATGAPAAASTAALAAALLDPLMPLPITLPLVVLDAPWRPWRGVSLDTARHFVPVPDVLTTLDAMAATKANVLHWHAVDAQSFPLHLAVQPHLAQVGAWRFPSHVYTTADIAGVVRYAADRGIRVVVEVDAPAHALALASGLAYPSANATVQAEMEACRVLVRCEGVFGGDTVLHAYDKFALNPTVDASYALYGGVLAELSMLFPDPYMHLGADEVNKACWAADSDLRAWATAQLPQLTAGLAHASESSHPRWYVALLAHWMHRAHDMLGVLGKVGVGWEDSRQIASDADAQQSVDVHAPLIPTAGQQASQGHDAARRRQLQRLKLARWSRNEGRSGLRHSYVTAPSAFWSNTGEGSGQSGNGGGVIALLEVGGAAPQPAALTANQRPASPGSAAAVAAITRQLSGMATMDWWRHPDSISAALDRRPGVGGGGVTPTGSLAAHAAVQHEPAEPVPAPMDAPAQKWWLRRGHHGGSQDGKADRHVPMRLASTVVNGITWKMPTTHDEEPHADTVPPLTFGPLPAAAAATAAAASGPNPFPRRAARQ